MQTSNSDVVQQAVDMSDAAHVEPRGERQPGHWFSTLMPLPPLLLLGEAEKGALINDPGRAWWPRMEPPQCS